jgi:folate-binding protein YgfZ
MSYILNGIAPLPHLGVIRAEGEDAAKFLHGQLTQDFSLLGLSEARLAAFCSAKGRMQASFVAFKRSHTEIVLVCSRDLLPQTLKRLSMFVLRAKVKLSDASGELALYGVAGTALQTLAPGAHQPWSRTEAGDATLVHLYPADGVARALWLAPAAAPAPAGPVLRPDDWLWSEVRSGVATVTQPIFEAFVPQMLNYESLGGVNFKKGCYPGQEVVARSQFRGTLKRRGYLAHSDAPMQAGQEVFDAADASQPCGVVAQAAAAPEGGFDAIVSLQTASAQGALQLGTPGGAALTLLSLPYPLLDDI